jgi:hypothetical protein
MLRLKDDGAINALCAPAQRLKTQAIADDYKKTPRLRGASMPPQHVKG